MSSRKICSEVTRGQQLAGNPAQGQAQGRSTCHPDPRGSARLLAGCMPPTTASTPTAYLFLFSKTTKKLPLKFKTVAFKMIRPFVIFEIQSIIIKRIQIRVVA